MTSPNRGFGSDNHSGVHPRILCALVKANADHAPAYGTDEYSRRAGRALKDTFGKNTDIFWVFNGTAANVLALDALTESHHAVLCADTSHLHLDECGAPERWTGCKVLAAPTRHGKLSTDALLPHLIRRGDQHYAQPRVLSIAQPTELGTVYTLDELRTLGEFARAHHLLFHIDGARLPNAAAFLQCDLGAITTAGQVDALSLGGSKNGFLAGEAVIFPNGDPSERFRFLRKQGLQLPSKTRFIAAQFEEYLRADLWRDIAVHSLEMAQLLARGLRKFPEIQISHPVESNAVFARIPKAWVKPARKKSFFYVWDPNPCEIRLMTTFDTTEEDINQLLRTFEGLQQTRPAPPLEPRP